MSKPDEIQYAVGASFRSRQRRRSLQPVIQPFAPPPGQSGTTVSDTRPRWLGGYYQGDLSLPFIILIAILASVSLFAYFFAQGVTVAYGDAGARLLIAKRVVHMGFGQLGGTWLPLPQLVMLPTIWNDFMYHSGIAGSLVSMISFVLTTALLYKMVLLITNDQMAGLIAATVFFTNPNVLYMQSTPMSELLLFLLLIAPVYYFTLWTHNLHKIRYLYASGSAILLATLTRYEAWVIIPIMALLTGYVGISNKFSKIKVEAFLIAFLLLAGYGVVLWLLWNQIIFGTALYFQLGEYAKPSNWVGSGDKTVGNWLVSIQTYTVATIDTVGLPIVCVSIAGLLYFLFDSRLSPKTVGVLTLLFPFPFFTATLYGGQRPLHVPEVMDSYYNVRFGLTMILPVAIFCGYLCKGRAWTKVVVIAGLCAGLIWIIQTKGIATLEETRTKLHVPSAAETATWLYENYDGGVVLMENYGNEQLAFGAHLPLEHVIYEGSYLKWEQAVASPERYADWIVMRGIGSGSTSDKIWRAFHDKLQSPNNFQMVYKNQHFEIYKKQVP